MFVKELNFTLVLLLIFVFGSSAQNIRVIDNKGTLQTFNPWRLNGNIGITEPLVPAIYGTSAIGSAQNFLGTTDNKSLVFGTNNIERLRIDGVGSVGIGTATPSNKLEITHGTAGNSGLRFTNLNSSSAATTSSNKVLTLNSLGDVILANVPGTQNIVDFSTTTPTTSGVVFTPNTPADESVVYQSAVDNSLWTYNGTAYVTYSAPASTAWYTAGTTNDAGNSKTSNIYRTGKVGIGTNNPQNNVDVVGGINVRSTVGASGTGYGMELNTSANAPRIDWVANGTYIGQFSSDNNDFFLRNSKDNTGNIRFWTKTATVGKERMSILNNGNVGIGTTTPSAPLVVQGVVGTGAFKLIAPSVGAGDNWWMGFGHGTTSTDANDRARVGVDIATGGAGRLFFTTGAPGSQTRALFIDENQKVGIGTSTPANKLEITQGTAGNSGLRFTNLNSLSAATTSSTKVLGLNSSGDVILTNVPGTQNIVDFSTATPTTSGVVFTPNTPADESVVYQSSVDNSMWTYNGTSYVTYTAPASTAWFTAGTTNDAGNSKTSNIYRTGNVGIGINNPQANLHIQNSTAAIQAANADAKVLRLSRPSTGGVKWDNIAQFNLGAYSNAVGSPIDAKSRLDLTLTNGGDNTTLSNVMTWQGNGNVGIGTTAPNAQLEVATNNGLSALIRRGGSSAQTPANLILQKTSGADAATHGALVSGDYVGRILFSASNGASYPTNGTDIVGYAVGAQSAANNGGGIFFRTVPQNSVAQSVERMRIEHNGNVGIGTSNPTSKFEVNGSATNTTAYNSGSATAILFNNSNLAYTSASPTAFNLQGMKDGGTYTLAVQGTTSGTASFSGLNPSGTAFTFLSVNNGATIAGKQTLYTFIVMGTTVYFYMATGF